MSQRSPMSTATTDGLERDEYRSPESIFTGLGCRFDLDVAAPSYGPCFVPSSKSLTRLDDGLATPWPKMAFVWMNPPFGVRNGQVPWIRKFLDHGHGIGLVNALTSAGWFHDLMPQASALFFPRGKTQFVRPDETVAKQPANGIVLFAAGELAAEILARCAIPGMCLKGVK